MTGFLNQGSIRLSLDGDWEVDAGLRIAPLVNGRKFFGLANAGTGAPVTGVSLHVESHYSGPDALALNLIPGTLDASKLFGSATLTSFEAGDIFATTFHGGDAELSSLVITTGGIDLSSMSAAVVPIAAAVGSVTATNLSADKLDGQHGTYYLDSANHSGTRAPTSLTGGTAGRFVRDDGSLGQWSTLKLPNAATAGDLPYASAADSLGMLGIGAANRVLTSSGAAPQWSDTLSLAGTLSVTGNSTLTGLVGVGTAPTSSIGLNVRPSAMSGTTQNGLQILPTWGTGATTEMVGFNINGTSAGGTAYTTANVRMAKISAPTRGANHTITILEGLYIAPMTATTAGTRRAIEAENSLRADYSTTADDTRLLVWDVTAGALVRVTRGAADSGGGGFRLLRIPN